MPSSITAAWRLVAVVLCLMLSAHIARAAEAEVKWQPASAFAIEGRGWATTAGPFDRLPDSAKGKLSGVAWEMSKHSAGIAVRFTTNASTVSTSWTLTSASLAMPHMPATGVSGVDLYVRTAEGKWRFIGNGRPSALVNKATFTIPDHFKADHECLLYLPLYNGVQGLEIGAPPDAKLEAPAPRPEALRKPVVVYGTSITQGGCASRPGMAWVAILGRLLDRPTINLGFSSSGTMEQPVGQVLAELDPAAYVIDCMWNMGDFPEDEYMGRVSNLVGEIRKNHPDTPIIFVSQSLIHPEAHPTSISRKQEATVAALQKLGMKNLTIVPAKNLIGPDGEGTVDAVHYNDLGMDREARYLEPVVRKAMEQA